MYDLAVIGAGWAGFNAALKAKETGLKACLIEKSKIGGTCLNLGCIPTKTLIQSAKIYSLAKKAQNFGLEPLAPAIDFARVQERREKIIAQLADGIQFMLKGVDLLIGEANIVSNQEIIVSGQSVKTKHILIASGSRPTELSSLKFDGKKILSSDEILNLKELPATLLIVGGGVIGCEFASLFCALGVKVTLAEKMPQLLPSEDKEIAKKLENIFKKKGIKALTNIDAASQDLSAFDLVLVCVGRSPNTDNLGLDKIGLNLERGKILVDGCLRTNIPNIYAAGDCTGGIMLAHYAAYQGEIAAENVAHPDAPKKADNSAIPNCIFTDPEISSVGMSEEKALQNGLQVKVHKFDFLGSGMARILDEAEGFIKVLSNKDTDELLGATIIGPKATELIAVLTLAISCRLKAAQLKETIFAHPTLSESIREALG
ncbi:MAG: dihydrolipoyl dehydrogenase [Candidatus Omnitrophica bacterium]|nr:dihydrolipoyl dehydrogenase [Candidatus Omnitrophota bacterium]